MTQLQEVTDLVYVVYLLYNHLGIIYVAIIQQQNT